MMLARPVMGGITSGYGPRSIGFHSGVDFGWLLRDVEGSRRVYSAHPGTVTDAGYSSAPGNYVLVDIGDGKKLRYIHLSRIDVTVGQKVGYSTPIGVMGDTGTSTARGQIHLHLDLFDGSTRINPEPYLTLPFGYAGTTQASTGATPLEPDPRKAEPMYLIKTTDGTISLVTGTGIAHFTDMAHADLFVRLLKTEPGKWDTFNTAQRAIIESYIAKTRAPATGEASAEATAAAVIKALKAAL